MTPSLYSYQVDAIKRMHNGCILCGGVGSGKSRTALAYYFVNECGGLIDGTEHGYDHDYVPMKEPKDLFIITTARKRDTYEWDEECSNFQLKTGAESQSPKTVIDSWNNIGKYVEIENAFFIFDEQRVVGSGAWVKAFLKIAKKNRWVLLSATPGDTWLDYLPVFIANGYYRNRTDFIDQHVVYSRFSKYPRVDKYINTGKLLKLRYSVLVKMDYVKTSVSKHINVDTDYDRQLYHSVFVRRWDIFEDKPIQDAAGLCYALRKVVNTDEDRLTQLTGIIHQNPKAIIFYNFNYELEMLRGWARQHSIDCAEWNGQKHEDIPTGDRWVYLVQYTAGAEGWNCTSTDTIVFYSLNYSYKTMIQAAGRTDRLNTPFPQLKYYHLVSKAPIDLAIMKALRNKRNFNENNFLGK